MNGPQFWNKLSADIQHTWGRNLTVIVAGGAVRDWMLGIPPNDIDLFIPEFYQRTQDEELDAPEGWEFLRTVGRDEYPGAMNDFNVGEFMVRDTVVQVMALQHSFWTHYDTFDHNMTKGRYLPHVQELIIDGPMLRGIERQQIYPVAQLQANANTTGRMINLMNRLNANHSEGWTVVQDVVPQAAAPRIQGVDDPIFGNGGLVQGVPVHINQAFNELRDI